MRVLPLHTIPWHCTSAVTAGLCGLIDLFVRPALPHIHKLCAVAVLPLIHLLKAKPFNRRNPVWKCATCQSFPSFL